MNAKNFMQSKLPEIVKKNNKDVYLDPFGKKRIIKPEEIVRQHLISYLLDELKISKDLICVEERLSHYGIASDERADIIINYYDNRPLLVIECKATEIFLDDNAREQLFGYAEKLGNKYCWLTNGEENYFYFRDDNGEYIELDDLPNYEEMLGGKYNPAPIVEFESRADFEELEEKYFDYVDAESIGEDTPKNLAIPMTNFLECLMDTKHKLPAKQYKFFRVIKDYELKNITVGDAGSNKYTSQHRSLLIEYKGNENFVSVAFTNFYDHTIICVAIDRDNKPVHHSLQLNVDRNFVTYDKKIRFLHDFSITVGNQGRKKNSELKNFVAEKYPEIIYGEKCYLGTLTHNRLWTLDDEEVMKVVENLISYALIRDDYRAMF